MSSFWMSHWLFFNNFQTGQMINLSIKLKIIGRLIIPALINFYNIYTFDCICRGRMFAYEGLPWMHFWSVTELCSCLTVSFPQMFHESDEVQHGTHVLLKRWLPQNTDFYLWVKWRYMTANFTNPVSQVIRLKTKWVFSSQNQQIHTRDIALATLWLAIPPQKSPIAAPSKTQPTVSN